MRSFALVAALVAVAAGLPACAQRDRPYRFGSPMLGAATVPPPPLPGEVRPPRARPALANREADRIRVVAAPRIREASAAAALAVVELPAAQAEAREVLVAPHRIPSDVPLPGVASLRELRSLVGRRDRRDPIAVALGWTRQLGVAIEATTGDDVIAWAEARGQLADATEVARPGDLLVFDHVASDTPADLVAIVLDRDARGVTEFLYLGGGVIRRGFVDASRPGTRRGADSLVVNTFLRHGRRWPAKGTHYLAGELLAHVVRVR